MLFRSDYLKLDVEGALLKWVDGKVIGFKSRNLSHQEIAGFLMVLMSLYVEKNDLGEVVQAGYAMKLEAQKRGREPDLVFVGKEKHDILKHEYLNGAADIAVEIISPESIERDRQTKFGEYEAAGVGEYWLIDPENQQAEFYRLDESGFYKLTETSEGVFHSEVLDGFFLRLEWLWQENPPTFEALRELNLIQ